jgi:hypothetical protein
MKYKIGQIYFIKSEEGLFSKATNYYNNKKFGQSDTTHCGIIADVYDDKKVLIFEATGDGFISSVYDTSWLNIMQENGRVHIGETKEKVKDVFENCMKYRNVKYGWLDIIGIGLSFLFGWKVLGITGKNKVMCSEAVCRVLYDCTKNIDFEKEYKIKFDAITPEHIFLSKQIKII